MELSCIDKKNNQKILPVSNPMITTYTQHAHLLSILCNYECTYTWIFSNYIQLYINKDYIHEWGDFYFPLPYELRPSDTCKCLHTQKIHRDLVKDKWESPIYFVIDQINSGNYVHSMANVYHIPLNKAYCKHNFNHDILIYGFNLEEEKLYVSDFFHDNEKYSFETISFSDFNKAFNSYYDAENEDYLNQVIYLYKVNHKYEYNFSIHSIIDSIKSYLSGDIPEYWNIYNRYEINNIVCGIEIYNTLINYITRKAMKKEYNVDRRPFYLIYDHKRIMSLRLKYLHELGYFEFCDYSSAVSGLAELEIQAKNVINLIIKYNISKNSNLIDKITSKLLEMKEKEYNVLKQFTKV